MREGSLKSIIQCIVVLGILFSCSLPARSEEPASNRLTLEKLLSLALENNLELKAARRNLEIAGGESVGALRYPFNPDLEVEGSTGRPFEATGDRLYRLGISQQIEWPGKRRLRSEAAEANLTRVEREIKDRERLLIGEVKSLYNRTLHLERKLRFAEEAIALNEKLVETTEARSSAGESPGLDVNLAKVELNKAINDRRAIEGGLSGARGRLNLLVGKAWDAALKLDEPLHFVPKTLQIDPILASAKRLRPDLLALQAERERAAFIKDLSLRERFPNPSVSLFYERAATTLGPFSERDQLIGGKLSIPLPLFNRNQGPIIATASRQVQIGIEVAAKEAAIAQEVGAAFEKFVLAQKSVALFEEGILSQTRENLNLIRDAYEAGEVGIMTVIQEQERFINTNISYFDTLQEYHAALIDLETAVGGNVEEHR
ncbi:MAG: TolC family protein [Candidatus Manganitrophaceae bacterium]|nr:MAG: TolC family protein [Candidatus Manganitrophaceae bacterium]